MPEISLNDLLSGINARKRELGIVESEERTETMRNPGTRRTASKRAMLERLDARARESGVTPPKAYY
jgi:hypothetical protein